MVDEQHSPDDDKDDDSEDDHDHLYIIGRFCLSVCVSVTFFLNFWEVQKFIWEVQKLFWQVGKLFWEVQR